MSSLRYKTDGQVRTPSVETLKELIDSRYTVYDVLPWFFNYSDNWVTLGKFHTRGCEDPAPESVLAAFDVYVRRSYRAYSMLSVDYEEGDGLDDGEEPNTVVWRFNLGQTREPPATPQISLDG